MWANAIPLVTLLAVVFAAGIFVSEVRSIRRDLKTHREEDKDEFEGLRESLGGKISEVKSELAASSQDQGRRIGNAEAEIRAMKRADDVRRELTGRHAIPREDD